MNSLKITLIGIISIIPVFVLAQHGSTADKQYNWSYSVNYDEDTNIIQLSKQYLDNLGRSTQSMSKNLAANKVMAAETVYDQYGRAVISTLPAPIGSDMVIRNNFITNNTGVPYSWQHFDEALLNNPAPVGKDSTNTLGIFYSTNGSEDYVATSSYPYSRIEYMADPTGRVKRGAAPGEELKMGSGKESQMYYMFTAGELDRAYGVDSSFYCDISSQNPLHSTALTNTEIVAEKTISIDAEGTISISFISDGLTIASCVSGMSPTPSVPEQSALNTLLYAGTRSADIHLPLAKSTTLKLPLPTYRVPFGVSDDGVVDSNEINYTIMDLTTNQLLQINTDYTIGSNRFVTFSAPNKHRFLRISYDYTQTKLDFFTSIGANPPNATLEYKLDYSHFSVNYYDFFGRLRTNVSPKGFDYSVNGKHTEYSRYDYNPLGLLITKQMPDEGLTEFLYSDEGVLRFSQNAQQKQEDKFSYFRYDAENRIVEKGEYIENGASTYEFAGYYDEANTGTDVKTITDSVSKLFTSQTHHEHYVAYDLLASADEIPAAYSYKSNFAQSNLKGKVSKTWNENHQTWYSYDYAGRLTFTVQELLDTNFNTDVDETIKTVNYTYAPVTSVILKEEYQQYHATEKITNLYTYNANTQPITVVVKDAANQTIGQADFEYYLNGQLKRKVLGHHLQGLDYIYTLTGALKSMNHPTLQPEYDPGNDGGESGESEDLFAFAIDYHENDYVRTGSNVSAIVQDGYYNGLIKAVRWKIKDENEIYQASGNIELYNNGDPGMELMYQYTYDKFYRLETANFGVFNGSDFTPTDHYQVYGGSSNDGIDYDIIGNITTLKRNGFDGDYGLLMDDLEYTYTSGTSQLEEVADNSGSSYSNDFNTDNGSTFLYNENGQMTAAYPDEVDSILYYPSGLIKQLINSNGDTISYVYNEQGKKIKTIFVDVQNNPNITTSTWYFTDAMGKVHGVYEKIDTAAVSLTTEVLYAGGRLATVSNNLVNYELTDHLGNVRVTFADTSSTSTPKLMVTSWTDYYPFGEVLPGRSSNPDGHLFGYQGQQKAANNSKWYAFQLRMYNPSLGRWNSTDPYEIHYSPYLAMANNPISVIDPDGGLPKWLKWLIGDKRRYDVGPRAERGGKGNDVFGDTDYLEMEISSGVGGSGFSATSASGVPGGSGFGSGGGKGSGGGGGGGGSSSGGDGQAGTSFSAMTGAGRPMSMSDWIDKMDNPSYVAILMNKNPALAKLYIAKKNGRIRAAAKRNAHTEAASITTPFRNVSMSKPSGALLASNSSDLSGLGNVYASNLDNGVQALDMVYGGDDVGGNEQKQSTPSFYFGYESNLLPVAKAYSIDVDLGMGTMSVGVAVILQGPDAGKVIPFSDVGGGLSVPDASSNIKEVNFWYTGDIKNFTIDNLKGFRNEAFLGGTFSFIDATSSFIWSNPDQFGGRVIGGGLAIGVSAIPIWISLGWNEGKTTIHK